ncbi:VTC domain-containing protein [candidate division WWE3 bacterium]|uniref:VTC domain-containing protein n=1 Tax=candidate division WWE3 bacterium TaxID=2053526 RepID=A0A955RQI1_UNCKA|nr:VTC domain-containing protein [candidate division WWE3 bacterium]
MLNKISWLTKDNEKRYERKYVLPCFSKYQHQHIRSAILSHPANLTERYPMRQVNSLYFDTRDFVTLMDNISGSGNRYKMRLRWYGNTFGIVSGATLEMKAKSGYSGAKLRYHVPDFKLINYDDLESLNSFLLKQELPGFIKSNLPWYKPVLINSYKRCYFENEMSQIRLTLDSDLTYYSVLLSHQFTEYMTDRNQLILEVKYPLSKQNQVKSLMQLFPYRLNRKSKYVSGIQATFS